MALKNPYTVTDPVHGTSFYGRAAVIEAVLEGNDRAIWLVGNERIGKTSLLYRLEELGNAAGRVVFRSRLSSAKTVDELSQNFFEDIEESDGLKRLNLPAIDIQGKSIHTVMRILDKQARRHNLKVIILFDEVESLVEIAHRDGDVFLREMRREMQRNDSLRVIMAATNRLNEINKICQNWITSPFLVGIRPYYLGHLEREEVHLLICQSQSNNPIEVEEEIVEAIFAATEGHPQLTQWLCSCLWQNEKLKLPTQDDLIPDRYLNHIFQIHYADLADIEKRILQCFSRYHSRDTDSILADLDFCIPAIELRSYLKTMSQLSFLQKAGDDFFIGNKLFHHWLQFNNRNSAPSTRLLVDNGMSEEVQQITDLIRAHKRRLHELELQAAQAGTSISPQVKIEIGDIKITIRSLEDDLAKARARG